MTIVADDTGMDEPSDAPATETPEHPRYGAFLIRVWANDRDGRVRLVVQQVGSTRQTAFADWNGIPRHIRDCLIRPGPADQFSETKSPAGAGDLVSENSASGS
jgi:hypothetical protein